MRRLERAALVAALDDPREASGLEQEIEVCPPAALVFAEQEGCPLDDGQRLLPALSAAVLTQPSKDAPLALRGEFTGGREAGPLRRLVVKLECSKSIQIGRGSGHASAQIPFFFSFFIWLLASSFWISATVVVWLWHSCGASSIDFIEQIQRRLGG